VFTDRSCFFSNEEAKYRLLDDASIFTAELFDIHQALLRIQESTLHDFVIYSDSLSSLESIEQLYPTRNPLLNQIQEVIHSLEADKNIAFVWDIPGHSNIQANEITDKAAINLQMPLDLKMNTCDLKSKMKKESLATWQNQWEQTTNNQLYVKY
jgi:ribonuclease HI